MWHREIASIAENLLRWDFGGKASTAKSPQESAAICPTAQSMKQKPLPDDKPQVDLTPRAYRLHNRNRAAAERYLAVHRALGRGH